MRLEVHKIGGSCLDGPGAIHRAADLVARRGPGCVVVLSALAGVTDAILEAARRPDDPGPALERILGVHRAAIEDLPPVRSGPAAADLARRIARIGRDLRRGDVEAAAAAGEELSVRVVRAHLEARGVRPRTYTGAEAGIVCRGPAGRTRIDPSSIRRARASLDLEAPCLVAGFAGRTPAGRVRTLGRGGSDRTAVFLARALEVPAVIWKDVPGILDVPPAVAPGRPLERLDPGAASWLARLGMGAVQASAIVRGTPVLVRGIEGGGPGTRIARGPSTGRTAIAATRGGTVVCEGERSVLDGLARWALRRGRPAVRRDRRTLYIRTAEGATGDADRAILSVASREVSSLRIRRAPHLAWVGGIDGRRTGPADARRLSAILSEAGVRCRAATAGGRSVLGLVPTDALGRAGERLAAGDLLD